MAKASSLTLSSDTYGAQILSVPGPADSRKGMWLRGWAGSWALLSSICVLSVASSASIFYGIHAKQAGVGLSNLLLLAASSFILPAVLLAWSSLRSLFRRGASLPLALLALLLQVAWGASFYWIFSAKGAQSEAHFALATELATLAPFLGWLILCIFPLSAKYLGSGSALRAQKQVPYPLWNVPFLLMGGFLGLGVSALFLGRWLVLVFEYLAKNTGLSATNDFFGGKTMLFACLAYGATHVLLILAGFALRLRVKSAVRFQGIVGGLSILGVSLSIVFMQVFDSWGALPHSGLSLAFTLWFLLAFNVFPLVALVSSIRRGFRLPGYLQLPEPSGAAQKKALRKIGILDLAVPDDPKSKERLAALAPQAGLR